MVQESISVVIGCRHLLVSPVCSTVVAMDNFWPVRCILQLRQWSTFDQSSVFYSCGTGVVIIHKTRYVVVTMYLCEHKS